MKITLTVLHGSTTVSWNTSLCDDRTLMNSILLDLSKEENGKPRYTPEKVLQRFVTKHQLITDYECPVCAAYDGVGMPRSEAHSSTQEDLFGGEEDAK